MFTLQKQHKRYEEYKESGISYIKEIPENWDTWKYSKLFKSAMGQTILKEDLEEENGKIPVYSATEEDKFFGYVNSANVILKKGDLVIPARGNSIGHVKIVKVKSTTTQTTIYSKQILKNKIYSPFIWYFLRGYRKELFYFDQTAIPQITVEQVKNNFIPLPPLQEQQAIANYLDEKTNLLDKTISAKKKQIGLLKEKRVSLINKAVTGQFTIKNYQLEMEKAIDNYDEKLKNGSLKILNSKFLIENLSDSDKKDSGIEWIDKVPRDWEVRKLRQIFRIRAGGDLKPEYFAEEKTNIHKYPIFTNAINPDNVYGYTSKPFFKKNTITVTGRGDVGFAVYRECEYDAIIRLLVLTPIVKCSPKYFAYQINSTVNFTVATTAVTQLSALQISPYKVVFPPIEEQQKIVEFLDQQTEKIDKTIAKIEESIIILEEYKTSLISNAVTGKVKIN